MKLSQLSKKGIFTYSVIKGYEGGNYSNNKLTKKENDNWKVAQTNCLSSYIPFICTDITISKIGASIQ